VLLLLGGLRGVQSAGEGVRTEHWGFPGGGLHDRRRQRYEPTWESTGSDWFFCRFEIDQYGRQEVPNCHQGRKGAVFRSINLYTM
jgi:hypothetical protein